MSCEKIKQIIKSKQCKWNGELLNIKCCTWDKEGWVQFVHYQECVVQYRSYKNDYQAFVWTYNLRVLIREWSFTQTICSIFNIPFFCCTWDMVLRQYLFLNFFCDLHMTSMYLLSVEFETQYINELQKTKTEVFWGVYMCKKREKKISKGVALWTFLGIYFDTYKISSWNLNKT